MTELQKGKVALNFMRMNASPSKFKYYKRFINNKGDIHIPGYDPLTGRRGDKFYDSPVKKAISTENSPVRRSKMDTQ